LVTHTPSTMFHILIVKSEDADASSTESGGNAIDLTQSVCPLLVLARGSLTAIYQTWIILSSDADVRHLEFGEKIANPSSHLMCQTTLNSPNWALFWQPSALPGHVLSAAICMTRFWVPSADLRFFRLSFVSGCSLCSSVPCQRLSALFIHSLLAAVRFVVCPPYSSTLCQRLPAIFVYLLLRLSTLFVRTVPAAFRLVYLSFASDRLIF
jgi:hypothetical protein